MSRVDACLPLEGAAECGYCFRRLVLQPEGDWACPRCKPLLADVHTFEDWIAFHAAALRDTPTFNTRGEPLMVQ